MRVVLNREKLTRVHEMIEHLIKNYPASDPAEKLIDVLVDKIRIKMRNSLDKMNVKNSYLVTLHESEALAFLIWYGQLQSVFTATQYIFERNIAQSITNQIDREYGTINNSGAISSSQQKSIR